MQAVAEKTTSNIGELQQPKSIKNASPFRRTMAVALLILCKPSY